MEYESFLAGDVAEGLEEDIDLGTHSLEYTRERVWSLHVCVLFILNSHLIESSLELI